MESHNTDIHSPNVSTILFRSVRRASTMQRPSDEGGRSYNEHQDGYNVLTMMEFDINEASHKSNIADRGLIIGEVWYVGEGSRALNGPSHHDTVTRLEQVET